MNVRRQNIDKKTQLKKKNFLVSTPEPASPPLNSRLNGWLPLNSGHFWVDLLEGDP